MAVSLTCGKVESFPQVYVEKWRKTLKYKGLQAVENLWKSFGTIMNKGFCSLVFLFWFGFAGGFVYCTAV